MTEKKTVETKVEPVEINSTVQIREIERMIIPVRGTQVMLDRDLAAFYGVTTSRLNEQVKRNIARFPVSFRFQLTEQERDEVVANCDNLKTLKYNPSLPFVFTEQGIAQLSSVLHSPTAITMSVKIMNAFVAMRRFLFANAAIFQRIESLEHHQLETDKKLDEVFQKIDLSLPPLQGVFFNGQIFDAYRFVSDLIRSAKTQVLLFDNYLDDTVLILFDKRGADVDARIYTRTISPQFALDLHRHNAQYAPIDVVVFPNSHDRFLCIDETVYHFGASLKDLGKKWFAFSQMEIPTSGLLEKI